MGNNDPFLYLGTKDAFQVFGDLNKENVIKGLKAVRKSLASYVEKKIESYPDKLILEGAFLDPQDLPKQSLLILIVTPDEQKHRYQYFTHREKIERHIKTFEAVRVIQEYLLEEAKNYPVKIVENKLYDGWDIGNLL